MIQPTPFRRFVSMAAALGCFFNAVQALAIDPLPEELENAPLSAQIDYAHGEGRKSLKLKKETAERRYQERAQVKKHIVTALRHQATVRQQIINGQTLPIPPSPGPAQTPRPSERSKFFLVFVVLAAAVGAYPFRERLFPSLYR